MADVDSGGIVPQEVFKQFCKPYQSIWNQAYAEGERVERGRNGKVIQGLKAEVMDLHDQLRKSKCRELEK